MQPKIIVLAILIPIFFATASFVVYANLPEVGDLAESTVGTTKISIKLTETFNEQKVWVPSTIYLKKGDIVTFTIINGDDDDHIQFLIPDLGVASDVISPLNGQQTVTFTVSHVGQFIFSSQESCDPWEGDNIEECDTDEETEDNTENEGSIYGQIIVEE